MLLGDGGLSVSLSKVVCLERPLRGVPDPDPGAAADAVAEDDDTGGAAPGRKAGVGFVCSKKEA